MKVKKYWILAGLVVGSFVFASRALGTEPERTTLVGLQGVTVMVEDVALEAKKYGLTKQILQTDTELRLRRHGIKVFSETETPQPPHVPLLKIDVVVVITEEPGLAAVGIGVELRQMTLLERDPTIARFSAATWQQRAVVLTEPEKLKSVRETVRDFVDEFINDYLAANPMREIVTRGLITAVVYGAEDPSAVIDGQIVHEGDMLHGITVVKIYKDQIEFDKNGKRWKQKVREAPDERWK